VDKGQHFYDHLHYHPEFQITAVKKGKGILYHGSDMIRFLPGDVFVLGSNIPHLMKNLDPDYSTKSGGVHSVSLFFDRNAFGNHFFNLPELTSIDALLHNSRRGIRLSGSLGKAVYNQMLKISYVREEELIISFLKILSTIRKANKYFINSSVFGHFNSVKDEKRLNKIINHTVNNLDRNIKIEDVAQIANLSKSQFSRYFKLHTGKTFIEFLSEMRIESSCTLLLDGNNTIEAVCYDVGYSNLSNFNRQFKKIKGMTPSEYRKLRDKGTLDEQIHHQGVTE